MPKLATDDELLRETMEIMKSSCCGSENLGAAEQRLSRLLADYPDSKVGLVVKPLLDGIHERQAASQFWIAMFYLNERDNKYAAELRLKGIVARFPSYSRLDDVLYQLGMLQRESGSEMEAMATLERLATEFKHSPRAKEARVIIDALKARK